jgi:D-arabinose 1-dehydrogenase-like Zn-dependent alcohol dehydrogenase|tara:strand:- start:267 stop:419 length:153 start_codon:yes stop_codon:yes gene_type:complete
MYFKNKIIDVKTIKENLVGTWSKLYELDDANKALIYLNDDKVKGRAVLVP